MVRPVVGDARYPFLESSYSPPHSSSPPPPPPPRFFSRAPKTEGFEFPHINQQARIMGRVEAIPRVNSIHIHSPRSKEESTLPPIGRSCS